MYAADDLILVTFVVDYITKMIDVCVYLKRQMKLAWHDIYCKKSAIIRAGKGYKKYVQCRPV